MEVVNIGSLYGIFVAVSVATAALFILSKVVFK